jgi:hypothetical protein
VENGQLEVLRLLLGRGAAVDAVEVDSGFTAFHFACFHNQPECVEVLARAGCDVGRKGTDGETGWEVAERRGHAAVEERLRAIYQHFDPAETERLGGGRRDRGRGGRRDPGVKAFGSAPDRYVSGGGGGGGGGAGGAGGAGEGAGEGTGHGKKKRRKRPKKKRTAKQAPGAEPEPEPEPELEPELEPAPEPAPGAEVAPDPVAKALAALGLSEHLRAVHDIDLGAPLRLAFSHAV